jgi:hypothetical protein
MNELVIAYKSKLDDELYALYIQSGKINWFGFIKSLDSNIISVYKRNWNTHIVFEDEEYKTWFILRWN